MISKRIPSFIQSAALGIASVRLAETLRSSTFKFALVAIGLFGAIVLALFSYVYLSTASYVRSRADSAIATEQAVLQRAYDRGGPNDLIVVIQQWISDQHFQNSVYLLADPSFAPIAGNLKAWPPTLGSEGWRNFRVQEWKPDAANQALLRGVVKTLSGGEHLLVGRDIDDLDAFARDIKVALISGIGLVFVLAGVASVMVTRRTVGRIDAINATSRAIMQSGLDKRIPLRGTGDEWDQVAKNLNLMLDRIEILMQEVRQVTDNVAHDLRTPLARMRGRLEKAHHRQRDSEYDQALIDDTIANLDAVLRIFSSITRIAQIEANAQRAAFRTVNIAEVMREIVELYDAAAEERSIRLSCVGDQRVLVTGDRDLIFDAVANLVDNAIKHGRAAGEVTVEVAESSDGGAIVSVADDGPGIPAAEYPNVFKRFYRLERSRLAPGNGLGLSLVAAVARLHGARIEMLDNQPGLKVRLLFPANMASASQARQGISAGDQEALFIAQ
jgi:signal transduction histidine kinase